jgi:D-serine dehydratase
LKVSIIGIRLVCKCKEVFAILFLIIILINCLGVVLMRCDCERKYYSESSELSHDRLDDHKTMKAIDKNLLKEDLPLPAAIIYEAAIKNNLAWMQTYACEHGIQLAPHGKTTMAPALFKQQIDAGAWGMTLATAEQVIVAYRHGVRRLLLANQLVGRANMDLISKVLDDPSVEFYCLVDSAENVQALNNFYDHRKQSLNVLIEIGSEQGRCGCVDGDAVQAVLSALNLSKNIRLAGLEFYEGVLKDAEQIESFLNYFHKTYVDLSERDVFDVDTILLTGAGSAWYDKVAALFKELVGSTVLCLIRPGCYLIHDKGLCDRGQKAILSRNTFARQMNTQLTSSLEVCAYVLSKPVANRIVVGLGKRDVAFDAGLPIPQWSYRQDWSNPKPVGNMYVTNLMDHHTYIDIEEETDIEVGDIIGFATSHPCLTLDKWACLYKVDHKLNILDEVRTYFRPEVRLN